MSTVQIPLIVTASLFLAALPSPAQTIPYELTAQQRLVPLETPLTPRPGTVKIVLLAGQPSNKPGQHEYFAGCALLRECLAQSPAATPVMVAGGWPENEDGVFAEAKAIVCYMDAGAKFALLPPTRWERIRRLMDAGTGLTVLHQGVEVPETQSAEFQTWTGGVWKPDRGCRGHWDMGFGTFPTPGHEILRGVKPFAAPKDGWLYNMHWAPEGVTPILSGLVPDRARTTLDAKAHAGRAEVVAWAYQRPGGGRSFAFTGCDLHANWALESQRRLVVNGILWTAGIAVPDSGAPVAYEISQLPENWDRK